MSPPPQTVVAFDSANPTGGDDDLQTPGFGPGNNLAMGNLLILAADLIDSNNDGLVDDPDDDEDGGTIFFEFARPVTLCRFALIDLDKGGNARPGGRHLAFGHVDLRGAITWRVITP